MEPENEKILREERASYIEQYIDQQRSFDRNILYLTAGTLTLSVVFLSEVVDGQKLLKPTLLCLSWISLFLGLAANLTSFLLSTQDIRAEIDKIDNEFKKEGEDENERRGRAVSILNWGSLVLFLLGAISLFGFASYNLGKMESPVVSEQNTITPVDKALVVPPRAPASNQPSSPAAPQNQQGSNAGGQETGSVQPSTSDSSANE